MRGCTAYLNPWLNPLNICIEGSWESKPSFVSSTKGSQHLFLQALGWPSWSLYERHLKVRSPQESLIGRIEAHRKGKKLNCAVETRSKAPIGEGCGWIVSPKRCWSRTPSTCEDVTILLKWLRQSDWALLQWEPVFLQKVEIWTSRECLVKMKAEVGVKYLGIKECQWLPSEQHRFGRDKVGFLHGIQKEHGPADTSIPDFCPPTLWDNMFLLFKPLECGTP